MSSYQCPTCCNTTTSKIGWCSNACKAEGVIMMKNNKLIIENNRKIRENQIVLLNLYKNNPLLVDRLNIIVNEISKLNQMMKY